MMKKYRIFMLLCMALALTALLLLADPTEASAETGVSGECGDLSWSITEEGRMTISGNGAMPDYTAVTQQPWYIYRDCIVSVTIGNGVTHVGDFAFAELQYMNTLTIGSSVKTIGTGAFLYCMRLQKVSIPTAVTTIGVGAFSDCYSLTTCTYQVSAKLTTIADYAFYNCVSLTRVKLPVSTRTIGEFAYSGCVKLNELIIQNGVTDIGACAFAYCDALTTVTIPKTVTEIGGAAFGACPNLKTLKVLSADFVVQNSALLTADQQILIQVLSSYAGSYTVAPTVQMILEGAFLECKKITAITLPDSVFFIDATAFYNCTGLTEITIPARVLYIGGGAFNGCTALKKVDFCGNAPVFSTYAFDGLTAEAYYHADDATWTEEVRQNYGGTITWVPNERIIASVGTTDYHYLADALAACGDGQYVVLKANVVANVELTRDLYLDLNGNNMTCTVKTGGYKIYGMDSTTDKYTCENIGYFKCVDETGAEIVPESHFRSSITGVAKRFMAIKDRNGYSFHRFYIGITHRSLRPSTVSVGYKAVFYGDDMVIANLDTTNAIGYTLQLQGFEPVTVYMSADKLVSGKAVTLRLDNYDVQTYGETLLYASMTMQLADGTVIQSGHTGLTMRQLVEELNEAYKTLSADQLTAMKAMIEKYAIIKAWKVENLI